MNRILLCSLLTSLFAGAMAQDLLFQRQYGPSEAQPSSAGLLAALPSGTEFYSVFRTGFTSYIARYDTFGNQLGLAQILDPLGSTVRIEALSVDGEGNAIVAYRTGGFSDADVQVAKYTPALTRAWTYRRSTPTEADQLGIVLTVDDSNNIYFGNSILSAGATDVKITKVSSAGSFQWDYVFNAGPTDFILSLKHSPDANKIYYGGGSGSAAYVSALNENGSFGGQWIEIPTVQSVNNRTSEIVILDAVNNSDVVMYGNSDNGPRFFRRLNSGLTLPSIANVVTSDAALARELIVSGGVLFASAQSGSSTVVERRDLSTLASTHTASVAGTPGDFVASANGSTLFSITNVVGANSTIGRMFSPTNLAVGGTYSVTASRSAGTAMPIGTSRVLVSSAVGEGNDRNNYLTVLNNVANTVWEIGETFEAPLRREPVDGVVDSQNNYYALTLIEGEDFRLELVKYNAAGVFQWAVEMPGGDNGDSAITIGSDDNPVVARSNDNNDAILATKFNGTGGTVWSRSFAGQVNQSIRLSTGSDGTLAMAAGYYFTSGSTDSAVWKLNPTTGAQIWRRIYDFNETDEFVGGLQVAPSGFIMTAGSSNNSTHGYTLVYSPTGDLHWQFDETVPAGAFIRGTSLSIQSTGLGATVHMHRDAGNIHRFSVVRFDPVRRLTLFTGNLIGNTNEPSFETATSPAGTVYVAQANPASKGLIQYNSNGTVAWVRTLPSGVTRVIRVYTDAQNSVYVLAEESYTDSAGPQAKGWYLVKYNTLGTFVSQRRIQSAASMRAIPISATMGKVFDLWLMGSFQVQNTSQNLSVVRYGQQVAPTVAGESYSVSAGQTLTVNAPGVLANDSDLNGDTLTASIVSNPSAGSLTLNANGSFTYVAPATAGARTFIYRVTDSTGRSTNAVCTINVN